jgi:hypothetical protein
MKEDIPTQNSEYFSSGIESIISQNQNGPTNPGAMTEMSKSNAITVSNIISKRESTGHCVNKSLKTTLYVPIINPRRGTPLLKHNGRLYEKSSNRTCWADESINAQTKATSDPLIQTITIISKGNFSIIKSCLHEDKWISKAWTILPFTKLELPIMCSLASDYLNCSAMPIKSSVTMKSILPSLRMKFVEQHWNNEDCPLTIAQPGSSICTGGIIIIIWIIMKIGVKLAKEGSKLTSQNEYEDIRINIPTAPLSPVPSTPRVNQKNHSAEIIKDIIRQNNEVQ